LQVPSHYAPNYPLGHPRRATSETRPGYSALPMPPSQQVATHHTSPPINMVITQTLPPPPSSIYDERNSMPRMCFSFLHKYLIFIIVFFLFSATFAFDGYT